MRKHTLLYIALFWCMIATTTHAQNMEGNWNGELDAGVMKLTLTLDIGTDENGQKTCTFGSPDQSDKKIPAEIKFVSEDSICVVMSSLAASYRARREGDKLQGIFMQGFQSFPLTMTRGAFARNRPQTPLPPYPYPTEDVTFENMQDHATLTGTISYPIGYQTGKRVPIVIMVTGSGQQDRDETLMGHKPFLVIADYLARHGIASLRYDDRGMGGSTGEVLTATSEDFMRDARAGIDYLRQLKRFSNVGVLGHSEGSMIAFMLGAQGKADFIISLAGPAFAGDSISAEQTNAYLRRAGMPATATVASMRAELAKKQQPNWIQFFYDYNPTDNIRATRCPVLALNGEKDVQVCAATNLTTLRQLLPKNKRSLFKGYPGLNHLFQHCDTGFLEEYAKIEETISPEVLEDIASWIHKHFK